MGKVKDRVSENVCFNLNKLREKRPLVHNITNYVVMNFTANCLLSLGASPVMAHAIEEVEDMVGVADSLVVNIGTLSKSWTESMVKAARKARSLGKPFILDPVGSGATKYRTEISRKIMSISPSVIRGNASEVMSLCEDTASTRGVDSSEKTENASGCAKHLAEKTVSTIVISGEKDYVFSREQSLIVCNGCALMSRVTGMGCCATAIIGAFLGVCPPFEAAVSGMTVMGLAGEMALEKSSFPGSFAAYFTDALSRINTDEILKRARYET